MATSTYQEGVGGASVPDAKMLSSTPTTNYGSTASLQIGYIASKGTDTHRSLISFDVSDLPAGAIVQSADLAFNVAVAARHRPRLT